MQELDECIGLSYRWTSEKGTYGLGWTENSIIPLTQSDLGTVVDSPFMSKKFKIKEIRDVRKVSSKDSGWTRLAQDVILVETSEGTAFWNKIEDLL